MVAVTAVSGAERSSPLGFGCAVTEALALAELEALTVGIASADGDAVAVGSALGVAMLGFVEGDTVAATDGVSVIVGRSGAG